MKNILPILLLVITTTTSILLYGQNSSVPCSLSVNGETEVYKKFGESITLAWEMSTPSPTNITYFRVRRATNISGTYAVWKTIPPTERSYVFNYDLKTSQYYFVTAWYTVTNPDGTTKVVESSGSNQVRVHIK